MNIAVENRKEGGNATKFKKYMTAIKRRGADETKVLRFHAFYKGF